MARAPLWKTLLRLVLVSSLTMVAMVVGVELLARWMILDAHQGEAIAAYTDPRGDPRDVPEALRDVDYLPRLFRLHEEGLETAFGSCSADHPGPTLLALGDSTTVETSAPETEDRAFVGTWPFIVGEGLGADWQVCVIAECGYHPSDFPPLVQAFSQVIEPDLTILLMCENDIWTEMPRHLDRSGGRWLLRYEPQYFLAWERYQNEWLFEHSHAWRYLSWRRAMRTSESEMIERPGVGREAGDALIELKRFMPRVFAIAPLVAGSSVSQRVWRLSRQSGLDISIIRWPADPLPLRRQPNDEGHMNAEGHRWVAEHMLGELRQEGE